MMAADTSHGARDVQRQAGPLGGPWRLVRPEGRLWGRLGLALLGSMVTVAESFSPKMVERVGSVFLIKTGTFTT